MTLKELCILAHKGAIEKGFWSDDTHKIKKGVAFSRIERNTSELLMLIVTELGEACEALRNNNRQKRCLQPDENNILCNKPIWHKDTFEDEIADTFIRLADMCKALGIDIEWQIKKKLEYNKTRPKKHGKAF